MNKNICLSLISGLLLFGCTERNVIEPQYTDDTDWTPTITLGGNNYQRVGISFDEAPSLQLKRNLLRFITEYQRVGEATFIPFDTIQIVRYIPTSYDTRPALEQGVSYSVRLVAQYRNGIERRSNIVSLVSPIVRGKILRRLPLPQPRTGTVYFTPRDFGFRRGDLYALLGDNIVKIDTASGNAVTFKSDLWTPRRTEFFHMAIHENTAILLDFLLDQFTETVLYWFDLNSLDTLKSVKLSFPSKGEPLDLAYDGNAIYVLWYYYTSQGEAQLFKVNPTTGELVEVSPKRKMTFQAIVLVDGHVWGAFDNYFDNRIRRIDPSTFEPLEDHRNPVFFPLDFSWDGKNFWVFDYETTSFAKLELEGL